MPTLKQLHAAANMVENGGNMSKAMLDAGYSPAMAKNPQKLTRSKGFQEILAEHGLTPELIITALVEDIKEKKGNRKPELELAAKLTGLLKPSGAQVQINSFSLVELHHKQRELRSG